MTIDANQIIEVLQNAILRELGDEVDLIFRYGSLLKGTAHHYSDIDISYVPTHNSTRNHITVVVAETMIDLYPIHWSWLEQMANFENVSGTILREGRILYQRDPQVGERFRSLTDRLESLTKPAARATMLGKAQKLFQNTGYDYYLLHQQAERENLLACLIHSRNLLKTVTHCLAVCNQSTTDTRKLTQVLALPKLPLGFAETVEQVTNAMTPQKILDACQRMLDTTRDLLLAEQAEVQRQATTFPQVFNAAYPELKGDIQHLMLACERRESYNFNLTSLYHELMVHIAQALTGIEYSGFNGLADYQQDLAALGFPDLLPYVVAKDFDGLHRQCQLFDEHLQRFLSEHDVALNLFASVDELQIYLDSRK